MKTILSLFDYSGNWSQPYRENGYNVVQVDIKLGIDILTWDYRQIESVYGILAAIPCTHFSVSGARWWKEKDADGRTNEGLRLVDKTLEIIKHFDPIFWVIENPVSRIHKLRPELGEPLLRFHPYEFGDPYEKKTCLWGRFNPNLPKNIVKPIDRVAPGHHSIDNYNKYHLNKIIGKQNQQLRSITPLGFAYAFYEANK